MSRVSFERDPPKRGFLRRCSDAQGELDGLSVGPSDADYELGRSGREKDVLRVGPGERVALPDGHDVRHGPGDDFGARQSGEGDGRSVEVSGDAGSVGAQAFGGGEDFCGGGHVAGAEELHVVEVTWEGQANKDVS